MSCWRNEYLLKYTGMIFTIASAFRKKTSKDKARERFLLVHGSREFIPKVISTPAIVAGRRSDGPRHAA